VLIPILFDQMKAEGILDIPVVVGGIIPRAEEKMIKQIGVKAVFHPFSPLETIVDRIKELVAQAGVQQ
jgi:methylmalonyl-CoA mutase cobalamin-binding domain/chain